jgi:catechol 2,3-dioxygenase-like lactoylglutathione lyase family enzyme
MSWLRKLIGGDELINDIDHVAIVVSDMDKAVEFYEGVLGLKLIRDGRSQGGEKKTFLGTESGVLVALSEDKTRKHTEERNTGGVNHIAFGVDDLEKVSRLLAEKGVNFIEEKTAEDSTVTAYHFRDPDGLELEICARTEGDVPTY